ncbi:hypothetical protein WJX81_006000 [Elliptochloris bilobata]|uniref:PFU domain-containing protein n=1 Tax=Elliptochloris bilobata TaxID=381761 RepID=A0AAW1RH95_9CHLO
MEDRRDAAPGAAEQQARRDAQREAAAGAADPANGAAGAMPGGAPAAAPAENPIAADGAGGSEQPLLLVTTVSISGDLSDRIELRLGDCPLAAAREFCARHALPDEVVAPLAEHLAANLERVPGAGVEDGLVRVRPTQSAPAAAGPWQRNGAASPCGDGDEEVASRLRHAGPPGAPGDGSAAPARARGDGDGYLSAGERHTGGSGPFLYQPPAHRRARSDVGAERLRRSASPPRMARGLGLGYRLGYGAGTAAREVHERLYFNANEMRARKVAQQRLREEAREADAQSGRGGMTFVSAELTRGRTAQGFGSYGALLYAEGVEDRRRREQLAERQRAAAEEAEVAGATWTPQISALARDLRRSDNRKAWQRLAQTSSARSQERLAAMRRESAAAEVAECTFVPAIDDRSRSLMSQRTQALQEQRVPGYEHLWQDAVRRQQRAAADALRPPEGATFTPRLHAPRAHMVAAPDARPSIADRLYKVKARSDARLAAAIAEAEHPRDPATGRPLFVPATGRPPAHDRNRAGMPIGEYLYRMQAEVDDKKARLARLAAMQCAADASASYTNALSLRLTEGLKSRRFAQIFEYLAQDGQPDIDLLGLVAADPAGLLAALDAEVLADVTAAAHIFAQRVLARGMASGDGDGGDAGSEPASPGRGSINPIISSRGVPAGADALAALLGADGLPVPGTPRVDGPTLAGLLSEAVARQPTPPRAYLLPSPAARHAPPEQLFHPRTLARSTELVARLRPAPQPVHETLFHVAAAMAARRRERAAAQEAAALAECTFRPARLAGHVAAHGRALKAAAAPAARAPLAPAGQLPAPAEPKAQSVAARMAAAAAALGSGLAAVPQPPPADPEPNPWDAAPWLSAEGCVAHVREGAPRQGGAALKPYLGLTLDVPLPPAAELLAAARAVAAEGAGDLDSRAQGVLLGVQRETGASNPIEVQPALTDGHVPPMELPSPSGLAALQDLAALG